MSDRSPEEDASLLEPSGPGVELLTTTDDDIALEERLAHDIDPDAFVKKKLGLAFWIAIGWFGLLTFAALTANFLPLRPPECQAKLEPVTLDNGRQDTSLIRPPLTNAQLKTGSATCAPGSVATDETVKPRENVSNFYILGTDSLGRDVLSRLVYGARVSLAVGFASIFLGIVIGSAVGLLSGYLKGFVDTALMRAMDVILAVPAILLALLIIAFARQSLTQPTVPQEVLSMALALGVISIPAFARLVRANTLSFSEREFVLAARTIGASHLRIIRREIAPNVVPPLLSFAVIGVAAAISFESGLAYLGVSVQLPTATWGSMINDGRGRMGNHPYLVAIPCIVLALTMLALYLIGDRLRQYFDVKESML